MNFKTNFFTAAILILLSSCMGNSVDQSKDLISPEVTLESLRYESVLSQKDNFNSGGGVQKAYYGLSKDTIRLRFTSDNIIRALFILDERSGRVIKRFNNVSVVDFNYAVQYDNAFTVNIDFASET